ncbi:unnamed protein product [Citrullus colocynthis]|uniref:Uncharacterized protein n=1 Tax=Citrullus colocynthis TaxID=252529 RepID=A0ABP0YKK0_9ROSI
MMNLCIEYNKQFLFELILHALYPIRQPVTGEKRSVEAMGGYEMEPLNVENAPPLETFHTILISSPSL